MIFAKLIKSNITLLFGAFIYQAIPANSAECINKHSQPACDLAAQIVAKAQPQSPIKISENLWIRDVIADKSSLITTMQSKDLYSTLLWRFRARGVDISQWISTASQQATNGVCGRTEKNSSIRNLINLGGWVVYRYISLDGIEISRHAVWSCNPTRVMESGPKVTPTELNLRKKKMEEWLNKKESILYFANSKECTSFQGSTPAAPWGNRYDGHEEEAISEDGSWVARSLLHANGSIDILFHFSTMKACEAFRAEYER